MFLWWWRNPSYFRRRPETFEPEPTGQTPTLRPASGAPMAGH
jgi:hypothetical protein